MPSRHSWKRLCDKPDSCYFDGAEADLRYSKVIPNRNTLTLEDIQFRYSSDCLLPANKVRPWRPNGERRNLSHRFNPQCNLLSPVNEAMVSWRILETINFACMFLEIRIGHKTIRKRHVYSGITMHIIKVPRVPFGKPFLQKLLHSIRMDCPFCL